jgi:hypothetical protein
MIGAGARRSARGALILAAGIGLLASGCMEPTAEPGQDSLHQEQPEPATPVLPAHQAPPPSTTFAEVGFAASACTFRSGVFVHKHEWAAPFVPPQFRQKNTGGLGNTGQNNLNALDCRGIAIGNQTFYDDVRLAYYVVYVEAPEDRRGPDADFYLLDLLTDQPRLVEQLSAAGLSAELATFEFDEDHLSIEAPSFQAGTSGLARIDQVDNGTFHSRLHWAVGDRGCWVDFDETVKILIETVPTLEGERGHPMAIAGPANESTGLGIQGTEDSRLSPPSCKEFP